MQVARNIRQVLLNSKSTEPDSIPVFGICCGDEEDVGAIVKKHMEGIQILAGRRFWDFISQDLWVLPEDLADSLRSRQNLQGSGCGNTREVIKKKTKQLESELKKIYGDRDKDFWSNMLGDMY